MRSMGNGIGPVGMEWGISWDSGNRCLKFCILIDHIKVDREDTEVVQLLGQRRKRKLRMATVITLFEGALTPI